MMVLLCHIDHREISRGASEPRRDLLHALEMTETIVPNGISRYARNDRRDARNDGEMPEMTEPMGHIDRMEISRGDY